MNDWRYTSIRPGKAHLWVKMPDGRWRSQCNRLVLTDLLRWTHLTPIENGIELKCKQCIPFETRSKDAV